jgi:ADP-ribosylglycohydrolase
MSDSGAAKRIEIRGFGPIDEGSAAARPLGALLGLAVADALGTTYEFERIEQAPYPALATGPATDVVGKGPFGLVAGQVTDDTQMAVCLARSLATDPARQHIEILDLGTRYVAWYQHAFDVGNQTARSLGKIENGVSIGMAGREVWHESDRRPAGNGSLMRTAPIGVHFARSNDLQVVVDAALTDAVITHADPRCGLACAAFDAAIAAAVGRNATAAQMAAAAREALPIAARRLRELWSDNRDDLAALASAEEVLDRDLTAARSADPGVYGSELDVHRTAGFVRVAFRLAFWHLAHTPSWRDAVIDVASRGGDADTNAAIVGALLGARDGVTAIPGAWLDRVLAATQPGPAEWADAHHPRHFLALVRP